MMISVTSKNQPVQNLTLENEDRQPPVVQHV